MGHSLLVFGSCLTIVLVIMGDALAQEATDSGSLKEKETLARAAIVAYSANMNAFPYYKCSWRHTKGQAPTVKDALEGKFVNAQYHDLRMIVDGEKELCQGFAPLPDSRRARAAPGKPGVYVVPSPGNSSSYLADGKRELSYQPSLQSVNLFSAERAQRGFGIVPLGMFSVGHRNQSGPDVLLSEKVRYEFQVVGPEEVNGCPVLTVRFTKREPVKLKEGPLTMVDSFSLDRSRGYLPIRVVTYWNEKPITERYVTHVRACSNGRWFPERTVAMDARPDGRFDVQEVKILELDTDRRPEASEFTITIPAGTVVLEPAVSMRNFFRLKQDEKIRIEDLPALFDMLARKKSEPLMDTAIPRQQSYRWLGLAAGASLAVGGALFLVRRRRRVG